MSVETDEEWMPPFGRQYGRNALPKIFDAKAKDPTSRPYAYIAKSATDPAAGFDKITYQRITNAINRVSWWLVTETDLGDGDAFAYLGPSDLRYVVFTIAALKTGRKILLPSLRNTNEAQQILFERTGCRLIIYGAKVEKSLQSLFAFVPQIKTTVAPEYDAVMDDTSIVSHYPAREISDEKSHDPILLLHTSGSSGNPKPVGHSPAVILRFFTADAVPADEGVHTTIYAYSGENYCHTLPPFHSAGCYVNLMVPLFDATLVLPHPNAAMTVEYLTGLLQQDVITVLCTAPSILNDMSKKESSIQALSKLNHVSYGGGPLPKQAGELLASRLKHLWSMIGSTENGFYCTIAGDSSKWDCVRFNTQVGFRFDEISPGIFELVIPSNRISSRYNATPLVFPELDEYHTKDLWTKANGEDSQGWWRYVGRRDDLIVLSNGEKINPRPIEEMIGNHPAVKGALIVGEYRFLPSLLLELHDGYSVTTKDEHEKMVDLLWNDIIHQANLQAPRFSRVPKSLVYIVPPTASFNRAGKGTIQRQSTVRKFAAQLDQLYTIAEEGLLADGLELADPSDITSIRAMVTNLYLQVLDMEQLEDDEDIFEVGMDSLQVIISVQRLRAALRTRKLSIDYDEINPKLIYTSVSITGLTHALYKILNSRVQEDGQSANGVKATEDRNARLQAMIDEYSAGLDIKIPAKKARKDQLTVVLTGSTGSLGSYLLHYLSLNPQVSKIVCLNRSTDAEARQIAANESRGLALPRATPDRSTQVTFLTTDLSKHDLGLGQAAYRQLLSETNAIVHSAWKVDFNHSMESFEKGHIAGTRHLIDFSNNCVHQAPLVFVSSIGTVLNWMQKNAGQLVPESIIHDLSAPEQMGYGESKYVGERLVESFSKWSGTPSAVLRVGQIAGPVLSTSGCWNAHEWFPSLLASSKYLGKLPDSLGAMNTVNWVPVDTLAKIIVQLLDVTYNRATEASVHPPIEEPAVYNLVNPQLSTWSDLIETVQGGLGGSESSLEIVSFGEWVEALAKSANDNHGFVVDTNPATKLLNFYRSIAGRDHQPVSSESSGGKQEYEVTRLKRDSSEATSLDPVSPDWVKIWLKQWAF